MKKFNEHTGCKITLKMDGSETVWKTDQWDCNATQLISAFAGLMIGQSFLPITVWSHMKDEAEDQMRFLKTDELQEKIEGLEKDNESLEKKVEELKYLLHCRDLKVNEEEAPLQMSMEEGLVREIPYTYLCEECNTEVPLRIKEREIVENKKPKPMLENCTEYAPDKESVE